MPMIRLLVPALVCCACFAVAEDFQGSTHRVEYDDDPIRYSDAAPDNAVNRLQEKIDRGDIQLKWDPEHGYLPALLKELNVPKSSQLLVFSKTSLQRRHISPQTPRAIYYNDDVYIGYIPGAPLLEVSAADPKLGGMFYQLEQTAAIACNAMAAIVRSACLVT